MKLKNVPIGKTIICNGAVAEVLSHGPMGSRVNVISIKKDDFPGTTIGKQVWSGSTECTLIEQGVPKSELLTKKDT